MGTFAAFFGNSLEDVGAACGHDDGGTARGERLGERGTDTAARSSDHDNQVFQCVCSLASLPFAAVRPIASAP